MSFEALVSFKLKITKRTRYVESIVDSTSGNMSSCFLDSGQLSLLLWFVIIRKCYCSSFTAGYASGVSCIGDIDVSWGDKTYISSASCKVLRYKVISIIISDVVSDD
jgi:hypothetical protein